MRDNRFDQVIVQDLCFTGKDGRNLLMLAGIGAAVIEGVVLYTGYKIGSKIIGHMKKVQNEKLNIGNEEEA